MSADDRGRQRETPIGDRAMSDFVTSLPGPYKAAAGSDQWAAELAIEGRGHSRGSHHRHGLHALRDDVYLDLVAGRGEPILGRNLGSYFEHAGDELFKGWRLGD
jgi:hypothetical protein